MTARLPLVVARSLSITRNPAAGSFQQLDTERLRLRVPGAADLAPYHRLHADPLAHPHDLPARHPDLAHSLGRIAEIVEDWDRDALGYWTVFSRDDRAFLGVAGVRRSGYTDRAGRYRDSGHWNVYYRLNPGCWGRRYAVEVISAAIRCCRALDPDAVLQAAIGANNAASIQVAVKVGMTLSHEQADLTGASERIYELRA
jgi:ribosomal-protein-alanine N-acetyltransferase